MTALDLLDSPLNPRPDGAVVTAVTTADGVSLRCVSWPRLAGTKAGRGTVMLLQGRAEFVEKYFEVISALRARGFAVTTFDWRGQGGSDRALANRHLGHVGDFAEFRLDYEAVRARIAPHERVIVLAHSMGGAIALTAASEGWLGADRLACTNPMVGLSMVPAEFFTKRLARFLAWAGLGRRVVPGGVDASISTMPFADNRLSADRGRYDRNSALARALGSGAIGSPTIGWLVAAYAAMEHLSRPESAAGITLPVLMVLSERDVVCSTPAMMRFGQALPNGRMVIVSDVKHEILMETDAALARFWAAFDGFVATEVRPLAASA